MPNARVQNEDLSLLGEKEFFVTLTLVDKRISYCKSHIKDIVFVFTFGEFERKRINIPYAL